jgi:hypothetical protein
MVVIALDDSLSVEMTTGTSKPCRYTVVYENEEITQYETSADPRTAGGRVGLRNIIAKHVPNWEKEAIDETLSAGISAHAEALTEEFGPR